MADDIGPVDTSFRTALRCLDSAGRLVKVSQPLDLIDEIGGVMKARDGGPALLFENAGGHDIPVLGNFLSCEANCVAALGLGRHDLRAVMQRALHDPIEPVRVAAGPAQDIVVAAEDIDLGEQLPVLQHTPDDSGRFITAGVILTDQELRNAVYAGTWVTDAKRYFSRSGCVASKLGGRYVSGRPIRQDYLETAIRWASRNNIEDYMGRHQHDADVEPLWEHFKAVIKWVQANFTEYRPAMETVGWGSLYDGYKDSPLDPVEIEKETQRLIDDEDVVKLSGIYPYILTRDEKHLNLRLFDDKTKQRVYQHQGGHCTICGDPFTIKEMQADHITPWSDGGKTVEDNCQMLCKDCNRRKSNI